MRAEPSFFQRHGAEALRMLRFALDHSRALALFHWVIGSLRRCRNHVRATWPGVDPNAGATSEAVYLHFDRRGVVHDYVLAQLRELAATGFRVTFVSNAPQFPADNIARLAPLCRQIVWRRNVGHDFGGYKDGIRAVGDLGRLDRLLLMNDSVYGPFRPLAEVLAAVPADADVWGITDSFEFWYHVQSYFLLFRKGALAVPAFDAFWRRLPYVNRRKWIVRYGEVRLTQLLARAKLRVRVLNPYWDVAGAILAQLENGTCLPVPGYEPFFEALQVNLAQRRPLNPTHYFCETLLTDFRCPFLKRDLVIANPAGSPLAQRWPQVLGRIGSYDLDLIRRHLQAG